VIEQREDMSIIYVIFMTAVILALVIVFGIRSRYAANPVRRGRHDGAQSNNQFVAGAREDASAKHTTRPAITRHRRFARRGRPIFPGAASPRLFDQRGGPWPNITATLEPGLVFARRST
jgi:hypothetical protein